MHSIVGLIKTSSAMTIPNDFPDGPVLLGQRTLQMAPANEKCTHAETAEGTHIKKGGCPRRLPLGAWFQMLYATFGSFVPLAMLCYGCQQNFAKASTEFACKYYMMDELKLDGVTIGRTLSLSADSTAHRTLQQCAASASPCTRGLVSVLCLPWVSWHS